MSCGGSTGQSFKRLNALSPTFAYEWYTGWMSCVGLDTIMATIVGRACSSDHLQLQLVQQTAQVRTDDPNPPVLKGSIVSPTSGSADSNSTILDISGDTGPAAFVRWGIAYRYASGQSQASGDVGLEIGYVRCGELVGAGTWQLDSSTTSMRYIPVSDWLVRVLVDEVKLISLLTNLTGPLQYRLVYRTVATDKANPSAWQNVTDSNAPYGVGDVNTGDLPVSLGQNMLVQFGIGYQLGAAGQGQGTLAAAVGIRRV